MLDKIDKQNFLYWDDAEAIAFWENCLAQGYSDTEGQHVLASSITGSYILG